MPPFAGTTKSKKKKGRAPRHQNSFAFQHNPKSKKTDKILASPNVGVCKRCHDKLEWRKKYRKYKPRSQPGKCNQCMQKNVLSAYHTICTKCAGSNKAIDAMLKLQGEGGGETTTSTTSEPELPASSEDNIQVVDTTNNEEKVPTDDPSSTPNVVSKRHRHLRVCAICTTTPALSKYSNASPEDLDIIDQLQSLEDTLESGIDESEGGDGHKLSVREIRGVERKIEKLQGDLKERRRDRREDEEGENGEGEGDEGADGDDGEGDDSDDEQDSVENVVNDNARQLEEEDDPFLLATGGKALVGEEYQKVLLARAEQQKN